MFHISEVVLSYFDKLETELNKASLTKEAEKLKDLKDQILLKRAGTKKVQLRAYYKTFDSIPFFNEEVMLPDYKTTGKIRLDGKEYIVLDAETYSNSDLLLPIVRLVVTK